VLSAATVDGKKAIEGAFRDIPIGCPAKPNAVPALAGKRFVDEQAVCQQETFLRKQSDIPSEHR
jgi:hypothetical protein